MTAAHCRQHCPHASACCHGLLWSRLRLLGGFHAYTCTHTHCGRSNHCTSTAKRWLPGWPYGTRQGCCERGQDQRAGLQRVWGSQAGAQQQDEPVRSLRRTDWSSAPTAHQGGWLPLHGAAAAGAQQVRQGPALHCVVLDLHRPLRVAGSCRARATRRSRCRSNTPQCDAGACLTRSAPAALHHGGASSGCAPTGRSWAEWAEPWRAKAAAMRGPGRVLPCRTPDAAAGGLHRAPAARQRQPYSRSPGDHLASSNFIRQSP